MREGREVEQSSRHGEGERNRGEGGMEGGREGGRGGRRGVGVYLSFPAVQYSAMGYLSLSERSSRTRLIAAPE